MAANNEVGTLNPVAEIGALCGAGRPVPHGRRAGSKVLLELGDRGRARLDERPQALRPEGVGGVWVRSRPRVALAPILFGGGHERGLRPGTLNVPAIVGFGVAARASPPASASPRRRASPAPREARTGRFAARSRASFSTATPSTGCPAT